MRPIFALLLALPLLAAGCVNAPDEVDAASAASLGPAATSTPEPFAFDGSIGAGAVACPMVTCVGADPSSARVTDINVQGNLTGLAITLTWDASAPNMGTLRTGIGWGASDAREYEYVEGSSPLVLELDGLSLTSSDDVSYWVWVVSPAPMGALVATTPQDFHAEGTLIMTGASA